ncbi:predicted dehydrogenase [Chthonomonas calidirosea]|uniref:Gfo/Idh/MocA family protein n=1 Tax=Chthonomonas calidirosea TaxID=454171 RepID=UPI0006DD4870|nr:Gfo/Idh/MocA family oxidoreductase [Chthonomonas calidirosea]CEK18876.1 predicted dehydrogenase [Chthonomonas calidirosea]
MASTEPVRIGIMSFAHLHADSYAHCIVSRPDTELVGIADHDPERARRKAEQFQTQAFPDYEALLADPRVQAVVICSENARHRKLTEMAAAAGKHVLCEKPIATSMADGEAMIAACKAAGVQLMISFPCRYSPVMQRLKARLDRGDAGTILAFRGTNRGRNPGGWFNILSESGGGATIDHTVHVVDLMRWLTHSEVKQVYAEISNGIEHKPFDDVSFLSLTFDNGVFATLDASWSRPKCFPTWGDVTLEVVTDRGTLSMDMFSQNLVLYSDRDRSITWHNWGGNMDDGLIGAFAESVRENKPAPITGEDGLRAVEVAFAAYRSAERVAPVTLPLEAS